MENYLMLNGKRIDLTSEQIRLFHFNPDPVYVLDDYTMGDVLEIIRSGKAREAIPILSTINLAGYCLKVIGYDHDHQSEYDKSPSITVMADNTIARREIARDKSASVDGLSWYNSDLREWLNRTYYKTLPAEIREIVMPTKRTTYSSNGAVHYTDDYLFLPTEYELFGSAILSADAGGERYEAFASSDKRIWRGTSGALEWYWTASPCVHDSDNFVHISTNGGAHSRKASDLLGVPLCFQIS